MAPRKRNKQDELNRTYRAADVGRVGSSLRSQGYSQNNKGDTFYTVGGVKYDAASGRPVRNQPAPAPSRPAASPSPRPAATTSGGSTPASRPVSGGGAAKITPSGGGGGGGTSKIHTYKEHGSALHIGRHKTLAEHRAAVEKAKGGGSKDNTTTSGVGPVADGKQYAADKEREDKKGRTSGVGPVASGAEYGRNLKPRNYNTPDERSKYVAPNGQLYHGPAFGDQAASKKPAAASTTAKNKLSIQQEIRKRRFNR